MVHDESSFDIRNAPGIKVPPGYGSHFRSLDGKQRNLIIEGAGGPSWYTEYNVLAGLSARGPWIPEFEELVRFTDREIPRDQGLLMIPGEDLFYYTTGRRPRFPVLMFDHTINPYSPEEIAEIARRRNICWLILKKNLQLNGDPVEDRSRLLDLLRG